MMDKRLPALLELHYLPSVAFFTALSNHREVWIEQCENYQKSSYRNRCHIAGANGLLRLSIPLKKGKNEQQSIKEVEIAYEEPWQHQHWSSISSAYGNAPYFEYYAPELAPFFTEPVPCLFEFSNSLLDKLIQLLQLDVHIHYTREYQRAPVAAAKDYRNLIHPRKSTPFNLTPYPQVFTEKHGFLPNLSILDLLFCTGPQASLLLESNIASDA
jgi:hypothetical protein